MPQQPMGIESYLASGAQEWVLSGRAGVRAERQGAGRWLPRIVEVAVEEAAVEEVAVEQPCPNPRVGARVTARVRVPQPPPAAVRLRVRVRLRLRVWVRLRVRVRRRTAAAR